jgi:Uma2 family endonuclease
MVLERPPSSPSRLTVDEFWAISNAPDHAHQRLELIEGKIIEMPASSNRNTVLAMRIGGHLMLHAEERDLGYVTAPDGGFCLDDYNAPQPDTAFIRKERADLNAKEFQGAPDLAVEIISPSESRAAITKKIRLYLEHGGQMVWVVYPEDEQVEVYRLNPDGTFQVQLLDKDDTLTGGQVLPDFQLPLSKVFRP